MILYITKRDAFNLGARTHLQALREIFGEDNVYVVDLLNTEKQETSNYYSYGYDGKKPLKRIKRYLEGNINFINNEIIEHLMQIIHINNISIIFSEESDLGQLFKRIKLNDRNSRIICFFHDISADLFKNRIKHAPQWKIYYILECYRVISEERLSIKYIDDIIVFNHADEQRLGQYYNIKPNYIIPLCLEEEMIQSKMPPHTEGNFTKTILFVCSNYYVNINGFLWFYNNVLNRIDKNFVVEIVGTGSRKFENIIKDSRIKLIGPVNDLDTFYVNADIVIAPIFEGGGMKMKTAEALGHGKCFIGTSESLNGFWDMLPDAAKNTVVFSCDSINEWVAAFNNLLNRNCEKYNDIVIEMMQNYFSYKYLKEKMSNIFNIDK